MPALIKLRRNLNAKGILIGEIGYKSRSFRLDIDDDINPLAPLAYNYNHSEVITSVTLEREIVPWIWGKFKVGYQYNFTSDFESADDIAPEFDADPTNGLFLNFGIFISPPDKFELN